MRLISQDGRLNFPYEYTVVFREENNIVAFTVESPFNRVIATYSTELLAEQAMCDLNSINVDNRIWYMLPEEKDLCASARS